MSNPYHVSDAIAGLDPPDGVSDELAEHLAQVADAAIDTVAEERFFSDCIGSKPGYWILGSEDAFMAVTGECSLRRTFVRLDRDPILREIRANLGDKVNPDLAEYALELAMEWVK